MREDLTLAKEEKWSTACHEAGHALAIHVLFPGRTVDYVTIQPRSQSLGFVSYRDDSENAVGHLGMTCNELSCQLSVFLAGREAERLMLGAGGMSNGAGSDLHKANHLAQSAVMRWGFDTEVGPLRLGQEELTADQALTEKCLQRVGAWLEEAETSVHQLLETRLETLELLTSSLYEAESIEELEFLRLVGRSNDERSKP